MTSWLPSEAQIQAAIAEQRQQRINLSRRVDDGPVTILVEPGRYGPTPRFKEPVKRSSVMRRIWWAAFIAGAALLALPAIAQAPVHAVIDCGTLSGQGIVRVVIVETILRVNINCGNPT